MVQGNSQDATVRVQPDATGIFMDVAELVRDDGTVVERERVVIASDENPRQQVDIDGEAGRGSLRISGEAVELLRQIDHSLKMILTLMCVLSGEDVDSISQVVAINEIG